MTDQFLSTRNRATHARRCLETLPLPRGTVDTATINDGPVWPAHAQAVKYIAWHVSRTLPVGVVRDPDDPNRAALRDVVRTFDAREQPGGFQALLATLLADETVELPQ